jgi:cytochrome c peroxidase
MFKQGSQIIVESGCCHENQVHVLSFAVKIRSFQVLAAVSVLAIGNSIPAADTAPGAALAELGRLLFFDTNLSRNRTQSCSSCHDPAKAFVDSRDNGVAGAASLGEDGISIGPRNAPTLMYAARSPDFHRDSAGLYTGGFFLDGRAATLSMQAGMPILDPTEMAMSSRAEVIVRIQENASYITRFEELFGPGIFADVKESYTALEESISAYINTPLFAPYDSRYDRFLRGEYQFSREEELGRLLFVSGLTNCRQCHQFDINSQDPAEPFTGYQYRNIGIPANPALSEIHGDSDRGLLQNPDVDDPALYGKFKVPTLRNIAVTGPYMHNGVFQDLRTTIVFYNQYLVVSEASLTNPETGQHWRPPQSLENIDLELLKLGQPLDDRQVDAMVAFLQTLTDERYEYLIEDRR